MLFLFELLFQTVDTALEGTKSTLFRNMMSIWFVFELLPDPSSVV